jgi:hypothetical protein
MQKLGLNTIIFFVIISSCGPLLFSFLYGSTYLFFLPYLPVVKDAAFYFLLICLFFLFLIGYLAVNKKCFSLIVLFATFVLSILGNSLVTRAPLFNTVYILRRFITPLLSVLVFSSIYISPDKVRDFLKGLSYVILLFGLYEYFFIDFDFWNNIIKLPEYWRGGNLPWIGNRYEKVEQTGMFTSFDLVSFFGGKPIRRMVSGFTEPTNFASFLISLHILFSDHKRNRLLKLLILICAVLTISKAAIIDIFIILPLIKLFKRLFPKFSYSALFLLWFIGFYFAAFFFVSNGLSIGPFSHINGFYTGINVLLGGRIFGNGIAKGGNLSDESGGAGGESGCGGMLAQTGIGAVIFILFFYQLIRRLEKDEKVNRSAILMIFAWTFIFAFSESSFGVSGNFLFWAYPGIALYNTIHRSKRERLQDFRREI